MFQQRYYTKNAFRRKVIGVITLLTTDYLFSFRFNGFLSSYRFTLYYCCTFTGVDSIFLQDTLFFTLQDENFEAVVML